MQECIKQHLGTNETCQILIDAKFPGVIGKLPQCAKTIIHRIGTSFFWNKLMLVKSIVVYYFDFLKDSLLLMAICTSVSLNSLSFQGFSAQLIIAYVLAMVIPLLVNSIHILFFNLEEFCGCFNQKPFSTPRRILMTSLALLILPFVPACIIYQVSQENRSIRIDIDALTLNLRCGIKGGATGAMCLSESVMVHKLQTLKLQKLLTTHAKCELFEVVFQTAIAMCLLSMNHYRVSLTANELQGFFHEDSWYVPIAILLSIKKIVTATTAPQKYTKNGFQEITGKVIYALYALIGPLLRTACVILYFSIPLGLFDMLTHWVYETAEVKWQEYGYHNGKVDLKMKLK